MRDHKFKLAPREQIQREVHFDFVRVVDCDGVLSMEFPTDRKELSDFAKGDYLGFRNIQREIIVQNKTDAELTVWLKTSSGATMQSALLVGDVNIVGVNQDGNDAPLIVREGRGPDYASGIKVEYAASSAGPQFGPYDVNKFIEWPSDSIDSRWPSMLGRVGFLQITNNNAAAPGVGLERPADQRVAFVVGIDTGNSSVRWIEAGETSRIPVGGLDVFSMGSNLKNDELNNYVLSTVTIVPELI